MPQYKTKQKNYLIFNAYQNYPLVLKCKKTNTQMKWEICLLLSNHFSANVLMMIVSQQKNRLLPVLSY